MEDKIVLIIIIASCIVPLAIFGIVFIKGRGSSLIAGFNTKSTEEQNEYDIDALCKFMGKMMFSLCFSMLFWVLSVAYELDWLFALGLVLFIGIIVFTIYYVNTGNRFRNKK